VVKELWIHTPWNYSKDFLELFKDGRITDNSLSEKLKEGLSIAHELEQIAISKKIKLKQPFSGVSFDEGVLRILGPSESFYSELLPHFRSTPEPIADSALKKSISFVKEAITWVSETMDIETLDELGETSAENNSSAVSLFSFNKYSVLLTSDAGIPALKNIIDYSKVNSISLENLFIVQVPHHGSKRNISPSIINSIKPISAYISCAPNGEPKHPSKKVTNAFKRRGVKIYATQGKTICFRSNTPPRQGWLTAMEIPFYNRVEE
jgi:hypothetical protein